MKTIEKVKIWTITKIDTIVENGTPYLNVLKVKIKKNKVLKSKIAI